MLALNNGDRTLASAIAARATIDFAFRGRLLTDPRSAVSEVIGYPLPASFRIKFVEKDPCLDALVVLPDAVPAVRGLSEEDYTPDGGCWITCVNTCGGSTAAAEF